MSTWFFLDRVNKQDADFQDELVLREFNRYQGLLNTYLKLRKSMAMPNEVSMDSQSSSEKGSRDETK
jgi:hypothetical protein